MRIKKFKTTLKEANLAFDLADKDNKMILESDKRIVIICRLTKEQAKKLEQEKIIPEPN